MKWYIWIAGIFLLVEKMSAAGSHKGTHTTKGSHTWAHTTKGNNKWAHKTWGHYWKNHDGHHGKPAETRPCKCERINYYYSWLCPDPDGDCQYFLNCDPYSGYGTRMKCAHGTVYLHKLRTCVRGFKHYPYDCSYSRTGYRCEKYGMYQAPHSCNGYIKCDNYLVAYYHKCKKGTTWNPIYKKCDYSGSCIMPRGLTQRPATIRTTPYPTHRSTRTRTTPYPTHRSTRTRTTPYPTYRYTTIRTTPYPTYRSTTIRTTPYPIRARTTTYPRHPRYK